MIDQLSQFFSNKVPTPKERITSIQNLPLNLFGLKKLVNLESWSLLVPFIDKLAINPIPYSLLYIRSLALYQTQQFQKCFNDLSTYGDVFFTEFSSSIPFSLRLLWGWIPTECRNVLLSIQRLTAVFNLCRLQYSAYILHESSVDEKVEAQDDPSSQKAQAQDELLNDTNVDVYIDPLSSEVVGFTSSEPSTPSASSVFVPSPSPSPPPALSASIAVSQDAPNFTLTVPKGHNDVWAAHNLVRVCMALAFAYTRIGMWVDALRILDFAVDIVSPKQLIVVYGVMARVLLETGDHENAHKYVKEMEALDTELQLQEHGTVQLHLGLCEYARQRYPQASLHFQTAVGANPLSVSAVNNLAVSLFYQTKHNAAVECIESVIKTNPYAVLHESLVVTLLHLYEITQPNGKQRKALLKDIVQRYGCPNFRMEIFGD